jgi:hypothetical protein
MRRGTSNIVTEHMALGCNTLYKISQEKEKPVPPVGPVIAVDLASKVISSPF